jgi:hypothetical protein
MRVCSKDCMKRLWPTHQYICNKHTQAMLDPTMSLMYAMDDPVYAASLVRLGNHDGERPDFWLVLPAGVQALLPQYMDVKSLCRTDSIMTNVPAREAWNIALKGTESVALSKWPRYSSLDEFKSLHWSMNRRVALEGIRLWKVVFSKTGRVYTDVGMQFIVLSTNPSSSTSEYYYRHYIFTDDTKNRKSTFALLQSLRCRFFLLCAVIGTQHLQAEDQLGDIQLPSHLCF